MRKLGVSVLAFCAVMYSSIPAHAFNGCSIYEHSYWEGYEFRIGRNYQYSHFFNSESSHGDFNDEVSSASAPNGCTLELYEHDDYFGRKMTLGPGDYWYFGDRYNDF